MVDLRVQDCFQVPTQWELNVQLWGEKNLLFGEFLEGVQAQRAKVSQAQGVQEEEEEEEKPLGRAGSQAQLPAPAQSLSNPAQADITCMDHFFFLPPPTFSPTNAVWVIEMNLQLHLGLIKTVSE